jgi:hypothetical protein
VEEATHTKSMGKHLKFLIAYMSIVLPTAIISAFFPFTPVTKGILVGLLGWVGMILARKFGIYRF